MDGGWEGAGLQHVQRRSTSPALEMEKRGVGVGDACGSMRGKPERIGEKGKAGERVQLGGWPSAPKKKSVDLRQGLVERVKP